MNGNLYILDTSVFIQAARAYYALDIVPGFWEALLKHAKDGSILSIDRVKDEIDKGEDALKEWANNYFHHYFRPTNDDHILKAYGQIMQWAHSQTQYTHAAKADFARYNNADAWVVAYAKAHTCIVVTQEQSKPQAKSRIFVPDVCHAFSVLWIDTFKMMRELGIKL